jgi:glycosyltransferase involved in cell wall biosynthesis
MGLKQNDFILVYPGEYSRLGGPDNIIAASEKLLRKIRGLKLILACRVKNKEDLIKKQQIIKKITGTTLADKIIFTDTFSNMSKIYNLADVILFPVKNMKGKFDIPLVIPEAWACEKPVIVSDLPIFSEFVNVENSVKIRKDSVEKLVRAIQDLYQNPAKREKLGKTGRKFAEKHFDIKKTAQEYEKIYKSLI